MHSFTIKYKRYFTYHSNDVPLSIKNEDRLYSSFGNVGKLITCANSFIKQYGTSFPTITDNITYAKPRCSQTPTGSLKLVDSKVFKESNELQKYRSNFQMLKKAYDLLTPYDKSELMESVKDLVNPCYHDFYNAFIPIEIQYELENKRMIAICKIISVDRSVSQNKCQCGYDKFCITLLCPVSADVHFSNDPGANNPNINISKSAIDRFFKRLIFIHEFSGRVLSGQDRLSAKPFAVHAFLSNCKKTLDWNRLGEVLGPTETNSAYCISAPGYTKLVYYRREELDKISLHEAFHGMHIEGPYTNNKMRDLLKRMVNYDHFCAIQANCSAKDTFNENYITNFSEGYVDFCADITNLMLYCVELGDISAFRKLLFMETKFALFQVAKLLVYFGFQEYRALYSNGSNGSNGSNRSNGSGTTSLFRQSTNVYSYFVIRAVLLGSFGKVIDLLLMANENVDLLNLLILKGKKLDQLHQLIISQLLDPLIIGIIDEYMAFIRRVMRNENFIELLSSMRRSLFELI